MDNVSNIQNGPKASLAGSEIKGEKLKALSDHGCNQLTQIPSSNDTTEPPGTSLNKRKLEKVMNQHLKLSFSGCRQHLCWLRSRKDLISSSHRLNRQIDKLSSVTKQTADNNAVRTSAQATATAKKRKWDHKTADLDCRENLTSDQRQKLKKLYDQHHCFVRCTKIAKEPEQLRPATLLKNAVPIPLYSPFLYTDCDAIAITLDSDHVCPQASYKCNVGSNALQYHETCQLKGLSKLELQIVNKLQERSERTYQPVYVSASSGKLRIKSGKAYFTRPKMHRCFKSISHNESLVPPYKPSDVQSILVPKIEFMLHLDQVLTNKSAYEKKYDLIELPITIYDVQTGERIHCYESQLFNPEEKKDYLKKIKIFRELLKLIGVNPYHIENTLNLSPIPALSRASPKFLINFVLNLPPFDFSKYFKNKEEIIKLIDNFESKVDLNKLCELLSDGESLNFIVKHDNVKHDIFFINHVLGLVKFNEVQSKDLIENQQKLFYILINHTQDKSLLLNQAENFNMFPEHIQKILFITVPEYVYHCAVNLEFFGLYGNGISMERNMYLHCAGYLLDHMDDSLCTKIIGSFVMNCIWPNTCNNRGNLYLQKNLLNILLHWKSLNDLEPEFLKLFKKQIFHKCIHSGFCSQIDNWIKLGEDLKPLSSLTKDTEPETKDTILNQAALKLYRYRLNKLKDFLESDEHKNFRQSVKEANNNLPTLPDHLKEITLPTSSVDDLDMRALLDNLKQFLFAQPLGIPDINDSHQVIRLILDRYYRTLGPSRVLNIENLKRPPRSHLHGSGHALRAATNIRLLMQLLEMNDLAALSQHQKQLLEYAAIYHDAAAEDVMKDRVEIESAGYFRRDMLNNCPAIYKDDILAIAEALEHKEDDIHNEENEPINQQQRLYRRLLRFADRLDSARYLPIPEDFPNFANTTVAGKTAGQFDTGLLDIDSEWLNNENFRKTLVSCIHGLLDLAAVSGGATRDQRTAKGYIKNYQLNPDASEKLNQFFENTPEPLKALEDLMDDNVRRYIAQRADLATCGDPEHLQCDQQHEHNRNGVLFGYTRFIHNRYHDLIQVEIPQMQLWEKLAVTHDHGLLSPAVELAIDNEVKRLKDVGIKRNIGSPSQETLAHPDVKQFLQAHHDLAVVAEDKLREVIPATVEEGKVRHRLETILTLQKSV